MERKQYWWQGSITIPTPIISWLGSIWSIPNPSTIPIQTKCFSIWVHHSQLYRSPTTQQKREPWNEEDTDPGTISALSLSLHFVLHYIAISIVTENMFCSSTCGPLRIKALDSITYPMSPTISPLRRRNQYSFKNYVERCHPANGSIQVSEPLSCLMWVKSPDITTGWEQRKLDTPWHLGYPIPWN